MSSSNNNNNHSPKNFVVLGLSGCTCGGKTSLSSSLKAHISRVHFETLLMDDYFWKDKSKLRYVPEIDAYDYDNLECVDVEQYFEDAKAILDRFSRNTHLTESDQMLILDGFILFHYPQLLNLCDLRYFYTLPYAVCKQRRETRVYDPPDVPGYFDLIAWPWYVASKVDIDRIRDKERIVYLDGTRTADDIFKQVTDDVKRFMRTRWSKPE